MASQYLKCYWATTSHTRAAFCHVCVDYRIKTVKKSPLGFPARPILSPLLQFTRYLSVKSKTQDSERLLFQWLPKLGSLDWGKTQPRASKPQGTTNQKPNLQNKARNWISTFTSGKYTSIDILCGIYDVSPF